MHFALFHIYRKVFVLHMLVLYHIALISHTTFGMLGKFHIDVTFDMSPDTYSRMPFGNSPDTDLLLPSPIKLVRHYIS